MARKRLWQEFPDQTYFGQNENDDLECVMKFVIPVKEAADAVRITEACADYAAASWPKKGPEK